MGKPSSFLAVILLIVATSTNGFVIRQSFYSDTSISASSSCRKHKQQTSQLYMSDDFPSDTSSEAYYDTDYDTTTTSTTTTETLVTSVIDELPAVLANSGDMSKEARAKMNEALLKLESVNPTENPSMSPLLNGVWSLRYAAGYSSEWAVPSPTRQIALFAYSGGYSPGLFALSLAQQLPSNLVAVDDIEITISRDQPRISAKAFVKFLGSSSDSNVVVQARLDVESELRLRETYERATVFNRDVDLPDWVQYSRELYVTYVDEDLLVVRDASGVPEVLVRKTKDFMENWGTDP